MPVVLLYVVPLSVLYDKLLPVGLVTVMLPVALAHVGWVILNTGCASGFKQEVGICGGHKPNQPVGLICVKVSLTVFDRFIHMLPATAPGTV
jgi:hypothetical protein